MSQNLLKRSLTSVILLSLLFFINFSHQYIFILSILILGIIICFEANNLFFPTLRMAHTALIQTILGGIGSALSSAIVGKIKQQRKSERYETVFSRV